MLTFFSPKFVREHFCVLRVNNLCENRYNLVSEMIKRCILLDNNDELFSRIVEFINSLDPRTKKMLILIIPLMMFGFISIYLYYDYNDSMNEIKSGYENLIEEYSILNASYYDVLNNSIILEDYYNYIKLLYNDLYVDYNDLLETYSGLVDELDSVHLLYSNSTAKYHDLQNDYLLLLEDFDELKNNYSEILLEIDNLKNFQLIDVLASQENIQIYPSDTVSISYNISYAGILEISYSSTVEIFVWVGSSKAIPNYYARYPAYPNTSYFEEFTVPVAGDMVYMYFENPSLDEIADVNFSVSYVS